MIAADVRTLVDEFVEHPSRTSATAVHKRGIPVTLRVTVRDPGTLAHAQGWAQGAASVVAARLLVDRRVDVVQMVIDAAGGYAATAPADQLVVELLPWVA